MPKLLPSVWFYFPVSSSAQCSYSTAREFLKIQCLVFSIRCIRSFTHFKTVCSQRSVLPPLTFSSSPHFTVCFNCTHLFNMILSFPLRARTHLDTSFNLAHKLVVWKINLEKNRRYAPFVSSCKSSQSLKIRNRSTRSIDFVFSRVKSLNSYSWSIFHTCILFS